MVTTNDNTGIRWLPVADGKFRIWRKSLISGEETTMDLDVTEEQLLEFCTPCRRKIQDIFPRLSLEEREFILTGITPQEWDDNLGEEEEDDG